MKKTTKIISLVLVALIILFVCGAAVILLNDHSDCSHADSDDNGRCDDCNISLIITIDFYAINDLHGKFKDTDFDEGVDELSTFLNTRGQYDENVVILSSGDMWQGSSESNLTKGMIVTDWMNDIGFSSMTLGNHEYDWGEEYIEANEKLANFPFLAINIFDSETDERVDYCEASVVVEMNGIQIGIIGAIGDCYSSISGDKSQGFYIKTGKELTSLVKNEAQRLRREGADLIVYSLHDGHDENSSREKPISDSDLSVYYDVSLSDGYVDLVFEGHTHKSYVLEDKYGVHHLQNGGDNKGISHAEIKINSVTGTAITGEAKFISSSVYTKLSDDDIVEALLDKYKEDISKADILLGETDRKIYSDEIKSIVSKLYYEYGKKIWGDEYDIVLGGGYLSTRSPYDLAPGEIKYSDLYSILPFDNNLVLCSISGYDLKNRFFETDNQNYYIYYDSYGENIRDNIDLNATYYIITDTYSSSYSYNRLSEIDRIDEDIFARDLLSEYIKSGELQ